MKNIITTAILPLLAGLAFSCTSTTALHSTESDDLYYSSSDRTTRPEANYATSENISATEEVTNPEYSTSESGQNYVTNNYNYYDNDRYYSRNYGRSFRNYSYYSVDPFYDPFYSPFGYSAAYCYNIYDPFWYPYCYPSRGLSISIGYSWGYPGYGYYYGHRPYGYYSPYDYYGYGYGGGGYGGGYYHGFYDGYYAGGGGYGYGYNRSRVNYGPRTNRSNVPGSVPVNSATGRPGTPGGRVAEPNQNAGTLIPGSRPHRVAQPGVASPGQVSQPANNAQQPQTGRQQQAGRPAQNVRPGREVQNVQPENYQFQNNNQPAQNIEYSRPVRDNAVTPSAPGRTPARDVRPIQESAPAQLEQPSRRQQRRMQSQPSYQPSEQRSAPVYENSRPSRNYNDGGSYQSPGRGSSGSDRPASGGGGRPRR